MIFGILPLATALALSGMPKPLRDAVTFLSKLPPATRDSLVHLIRSIIEGDDEASARAYEMARQAAFLARQR